MSDIVLVEERDHVAWVTLNRAEVRNALSRAVNLRLQEIAAGLPADGPVDVIHAAGVIHPVTPSASRRARTCMRSC